MRFVKCVWVIVKSPPFLVSIALILLIAFFSYWALYSFLVLKNSPWTPSPSTSSRAVAWEMQGRSLWIVSSSMLALGLLVTLWVGGRSMRIALRHLPRSTSNCVILWAALIATIVFIVGMLFPWNWGLAKFVFWPEAEFAPGTKLGDVYQLHIALGLSGAVLLIAGCTALYNIPELAPRVDSLSMIRERLSWLDNSLYAAAFLTAGAALSFRSLTWWQTALIADEESAAFYSQFSNSIPTAVGVGYGLIIAAVYASVRIPLSLKGVEIVDSIVALYPELQKNSLLEEYAIERSVSSVMSRMAACLGPAIVGPAAELLR